MPKVSKTVRFFEPMVTNAGGQRMKISNDFWRETWAQVQATPHEDRIHRHNTVRFYGEAGRELSPAVPYFYIGRLRPPNDHPDAFRPGAGITGPLQPRRDGDEISEPTYLVPFGRRNYVAMMSPTSGGASVAALERWFTRTLGIWMTGHGFELVTVIDRAMERKLATSPGASRLQVRVAPGAEVPDNLTGTMMRAVRQATATAPDDLFVEMTWSAGHRRAGHDTRSDLLAAARSVWSGDWAEKAQVNLQVEDEEGQRTEVHHLVNDRITLQSKIELPENAPPPRQSVVAGIQDAIDRFNRQADGT